MTIKAVSGAPAIPLASIPPVAVGLDNTIGTQTAAARADHTHASKVQRAILTLDSAGQATMTFARPTVGQPAVTCLYQESASNQPIIIKAASFTNDGNGNYTSVTIQAYRAQVIPTNIVTALLSGAYNLFGGGSIAGINVSIFVADVTQ